MSLLFSHRLTRFVFISSFLVPVFSHSQTWLWAKSTVGTGLDIGYSVSADAVGNVFVTGEFLSSAITFGSITLINTNPGSPDVFIAKYDATGNVLWAKSVGGTGDDRGYSVSADAGGNVFVTGYFYSPTLTFSSTILTNSGSGDVFIAKYDATGNMLWAKSVGGINDDYSYSVSTDKVGNVFVTGYFQSHTIAFGSTTLTNAGIINLFIAKYDANGNVLWAKSAAGAVQDYGYCVSADAVGNVFVTGYFGSPAINFGSTTLINTNAGGSFVYPDVFIAKYDSAGNILWAKSAGGTNIDVGYSVSADKVGNVFVTGYFESPTITFNSTILTNAGVGNVFIAKYDANGNVLWAKGAGGTSLDVGFSVSADAAGNFFVAGGFQSSTMTFGSTVLTQPVGSVAPVFFVKYDTAGNVLCTSALTNGGNDKNIISADPFGNVFIGGGFTSNPFIVGSNTLTLTGQANVFVAKFICDSLNATVSQDYTFFAPNLFTPNGDGINDLFFFKTSGIFNLNCTIYDRWGVKLYEWNTLSGHWDGINQSGVTASDGVYYYVAKGTKINNEDFSSTGCIELIR